MMDCSSLFLVLHTKVAQICIQVYPPVHGLSCWDWQSTCQLVLLGKPMKSASKWAGMKTHLAGSSVDSSCSSLAPSLSLQQASSVPQTIHAILSTYNHRQNFTILSSSPAKKLYYHHNHLQSTWVCLILWTSAVWTREYIDFPVRSSAE